MDFPVLTLTRPPQLRESLLHAAAAAGRDDIVTALVGDGNDVDPRDAFNQTPLCVPHTRGGRCLRWPARSSPFPPRLTPCPPLVPPTHRHHAARGNAANAAALLLDAGADVGAREEVRECTVGPLSCQVLQQRTCATH